MRYYTINIIRPAQPAANGRPAEAARTLRRYTTQTASGLIEPNALDIEVDINVTEFATPFGASYVRIYGIDQKTISQSNDFNLARIEVFGGMQRGLPLSNPRQAALLAAGTIQQAFGNWVGTEQTLDLIFTAGDTRPDQIINGVIDWKRGTWLGDAIRSTLKQAFPQYTATINISRNLVLTQDQPGAYGSLLQFARFCQQVSRGIIGKPDYRGVQILLKEREFIVQDGSTQASAKVISFVDLVGQITWLAASTVSIMTVMRGDIQAGDFVKLPPGPALTTPASQSQVRARDPFSGVFQINNARHTGRFRGEGGTAWVTVFQATGPIRG